MNDLLGIDIGTTHCKAAVFAEDGGCMALALRPTRIGKDRAGYDAYDPYELWGTVESVVSEVVERAGRPIGAVGVSSMAETGLLLDRRTGEPVTAFIPWFDRRAEAEAEELAGLLDPAAQFRKTGLRPSFKYGLPKLRWLQKRDAALLSGTVWLSASDYIAYRLTGEIATDYTLAARTYAFLIDGKRWDEETLREAGFDPALFPDALPSGCPVGALRIGTWSRHGLKAGTPVAIAGHDHLCAALGAGSWQDGTMFNSVGTAETIVGTMPEKPLGNEEYASGLTFGRHIVPDRLFWMGSLPASGGSVEWARKLLADPALSYEDVRRLLAEAPDRPTGILYFPYLSGAGAPKPDPGVKAAFLGLSAAHGRPDLLRSVLEGVCFQMRAILEVGRSLPEFGHAADSLAVVGGGTKNEHWMQIKADVFGMTLRVPRNQEAALAGAAMAAAIGCGLYADVADAMKRFGNEAVRRYDARPGIREAYERVYTERFLPLADMMERWKWKG
mgnify:CR=1 FL=1|jgi:xylulokinase